MSGWPTLTQTGVDYTPPLTAQDLAGGTPPPPKNIKYMKKGDAIATANTLLDQRQGAAEGAPMTINPPAVTNVTPQPDVSVPPQTPADAPPGAVAAGPPSQQAQAPVMSQPLTVPALPTPENPNQTTAPNGSLDASMPAVAGAPKLVTPGYGQASTDPNTGLPSAAGAGLSKLGKLFTLLRIAGTGAAEGSQGHNFGQGFAMAQQAQDQQQAQNQAMQQHQMNLQTQRAALAYLPNQMAFQRLQAQKAMDVQDSLINKNQSTAGLNDAKATQQGTQHYKAVPGVGLFDTKTNQMVPGSAQGVAITPELAQQYKIPTDFIGKQMSMSNLASLERAQVFQNMPVMTDAGLVVVNRGDSSATPVKGPGGQGYGPASLAGPHLIADPDNPGQSKYVSGSTALATGAAGPNSASMTVAKKAMGAEVPSNIGDQKVAFTTAIQHAELLKQVVTALDNGDERTINSLRNRFEAEFGSKDLNDFKVVAGAYTHEITKMLAASHMTDTEIKENGATLPDNANAETMLSALDKYQSLAQSKMTMLNQQEQAAINKSQPKAKQAAGGGPPAAAPPVITQPPAAGYTRITASDGRPHDIPTANLAKARIRDPGLTVMPTH